MQIIPEGRQRVYLDGSGGGVLMGLAGQAKGTDAEEALLITAELQEAAIIDAHLLLHQVHGSLDLSHL